MLYSPAFRVSSYVLLQERNNSNSLYKMEPVKYAQSVHSVYSKVLKHFNITHKQTFVRGIVNETRRVKSYRNFSISPPFFIDERSRILFSKNLRNLKAMQGRSPETLHGELFIVRNGTLDVTSDCGFRSDTAWVRPNRMVQSTDHWFPVLVPLMVPQGNTFQHFIDGVLPKIIQALSLLQSSSVKILMNEPRDGIIYEMFNRLNISSDQLVFFKGRESIYGADILIYPCITPPVHPALWQEARRRLGAPEKLQLPLKHANIVLVTRKGCSNCGRFILNKDEVVNMLTNRYGSELVKVFEGPISLAESVKLFGDARIILGSHGGGMYNINFAPSETVVIEFMPTHDDGVMGAASDGIIWTMAQMLGQEYWRIALAPEKNNNVTVDLTVLTRLLDVVDKNLDI